MNLNLLIILPLLTSLAILFAGSKNTVRMIALAGAAIQLLICGILLIQFNKYSVGLQNGQMIFESSSPWFSSLNINYHIGVDGISIAMIREDDQRIFPASHIIKCRSLWIFHFAGFILYVFLP